MCDRIVPDPRVADLWTALDAMATALTAASRAADLAQVIADDLKYHEAGSTVLDVRTGLSDCYIGMATLFAASEWHRARRAGGDGGT